MYYKPEPLGPTTALKGFRGPIMRLPRYDLKFSTSMYFKRGGIFKDPIRNLSLMQVHKNNYKRTTDIKHQPVKQRCSLVLVFCSHKTTVHSADVRNQVISTANCYQLKSLENQSQKSNRYCMFTKTLPIAAVHCNFNKSQSNSKLSAYYMQQAIIKSLVILRLKVSVKNSDAFFKFQVGNENN